MAKLRTTEKGDRLFSLKMKFPYTDILYDQGHMTKLAKELINSLDVEIEIVEIVTVNKMSPKEYLEQVKSGTLWDITNEL